LRCKKEINLALVNDAAADLKLSARSFLSESLVLVKQSVRELRTLSYLLHPPFLEELALISVLSWYVEGFTRRSGIQIPLEVCPEPGRLPDDVELALFRVVQGSLTNIYRHAESATASIRLTQRLGRVCSRSRTRAVVCPQGSEMP